MASRALGEAASPCWRSRAVASPFWVWGFLVVSAGGLFGATPSHKFATWHRPEMRHSALRVCARLPD
eukprot:5694018-Alexandrium_andersonii.AAC.1